MQSCGSVTLPRCLISSAADHCSQGHILYQMAVRLLPESCPLHSHRVLPPALSCSCLQVKLRVAAAKLLHQIGMEAAPQELVVQNADAARAMLERVLHQHTSGKPAESQ